MHMLKRLGMHMLVPMDANTDETCKDTCPHLSSPSKHIQASLYCSRTCAAHCRYDCADGYLIGAGIPGRCDLIMPSFTRAIAEELLEDFAKFWENPAALLGYDPFYPF